MKQINYVPKLNYLIHKIFFNNKRLFNYLAEIENNLNSKIKKININKPVFVCGMARSGTTLVTSFLNSLGTLGSPTYQDMPFINTPLVWNSIREEENFSIQNFIMEKIVILNVIMETIWLST